MVLAIGLWTVGIIKKMFYVGFIRASLFSIVSYDYGLFTMF